MLEHFRHFWIKVPNIWFGEMVVGNFEEIVAVQFANGRRNLIEHAANKLTPPAFVVILARTIDCGSPWHLFPDSVKCTVELFGIQL